MEDQQERVQNHEELSEEINGSQGPQPAGPVRGKRLTIQISEKQIMGNNMHGIHKKVTEGAKGGKNMGNIVRAYKEKANQAVATNEHTLVRRDINGIKTTTIIGVDTDTVYAEFSTKEGIILEHSGDRRTN